MASAELQQVNVTPETSSDNKRVAFIDRRHNSQSLKRVRSDKRAYKRSYSFSGSGNNGKYAHSYKRWKKDSFGMVPPTKFLLGGNICDPLNLSSLQDEETNRALNAVTPQSSPLPTPKHRRGEIEVLIPPNIKDPLNLAGPEEDDLEAQLISPNHKRRKSRNRRRKRTSEDADDQDKTHVSDTDAGVPETSTPAGGPPKEKEVKEKKEKVWRPSEKDKIVSPVVPQPGARKRPVPHGRNRQHSRSFSGSSQAHSVHNCPPKVPRKKPQGSAPQFQNKNKKFQYGNYNRYYGYRNPNSETDPRLRSFRREWFDGLEVLDVGCNVGHVTLAVAREYSPRRIVGIDIDGNLIEAAKKNVIHYLSCQPSRQDTFPSSMPTLYGPLEAHGTANLCSNEVRPFPHNVSFVKGNYVLESDSQLLLEKPQFDTIMCLSVTKWVQLNWGDAGLKRMFHRMFRQLRPGGRLLLEVQALPSYRRKKTLTETIYQNFHNMQLFPDKFSEFLLSEVGFSTCKKIGQPHHYSKGFQRPLQLYTKPGLTPLHVPQLTPLRSSAATPVEAESRKGGEGVSATAVKEEIPVTARTGSEADASSITAQRLEVTPPCDTFKMPSPIEESARIAPKSSEKPTSENEALVLDCTDKSETTGVNSRRSDNSSSSCDRSSVGEVTITGSDMKKM